jgi:hypothetical protein
MPQRVATGVVAMARQRASEGIDRAPPCRTGYRVYSNLMSETMTRDDMKKTTAFDRLSEGTRRALKRAARRAANLTTEQVTEIDHEVNLHDGGRGWLMVGPAQVVVDSNTRRAYRL